MNMISLGLTGLALNPHTIVTPLVVSGLTGGHARPGDHKSLFVAFPKNVTAWTRQSWGVGRYGDTTYGTGAGPTDYSASDGETLLWRGEGSDGNTYRASAPIRYAAGSDPDLGGQDWTVDDEVISLDASATGANLTFTYAASGLPGNAKIDAATGEMTVSGNGGTFARDDVGSGAMTITATDQYGRKLSYSIPYAISLRMQAMGGADPDLSLAMGLAVSATDLKANWATNGNTLTYAITGPALPAGLSVDSAGVMTGTPVTAAADATYTLRGTDEYNRPTDDTFSLEVRATLAIIETREGTLEIADLGGGNLSITIGDVVDPASYNGTYTEDVDGNALTLTALASGPQCLVAPDIGDGGTPVAGEETTGIPALWLYDTGNGAPAIANQWNRDGAPISGATGASYTLQEADQGTTLTLTETATDSGGARSATSAGILAGAGSEITSIVGQTDGIHVTYTGTLTIAGRTDGISLEVL